MPIRIWYSPLRIDSSALSKLPLRRVLSRSIRMVLYSGNSWPSCAPTVLYPHQPLPSFAEPQPWQLYCICPCEPQWWAAHFIAVLVMGVVGVAALTLGCPTAIVTRNAGEKPRRLRTALPDLILVALHRQWVTRTNHFPDIRLSSNTLLVVGNTRHPHVKSESGGLAAPIARCAGFQGWRCWPNTTGICALCARGIATSLAW